MIVSVSRTVTGVPAPQAARSKYMTIRTVGAATGLTVPYSPLEVEKSALASTWEEITRAGLSSILSRSGQPRTQLGFELFIGSRDPDASIATILQRLTDYAATKKQLELIYSSFENGYWQINSMTQRVTRRHPVTQEPTRATVTVTFIQGNALVRGTGPASGGKSSEAPYTLNTAVEYRVKQGDTLHKIAIKFYKKASKWRAIAKINGITNPKSKKQLKPGRRLIIPRG